MPQLNRLIQQVHQARQRFILATDGLTAQQVNFKSTIESWSILQITEHIVLAERAGVYKMWMALEVYKDASTTWEKPPVHHGLSIDEIIAKTWQPKEQVPEIAKPTWGGTLAFWVASLKACHPVLEELGNALQGLNLEKIIYPHPISGPMNMEQRIEFLSFHLDRHRQQIENIKEHKNFPT